MYSVAKSMIAMFACTAAVEAKKPFCYENPKDPKCFCKSNGLPLVWYPSKGYYACPGLAKLADEAVAKDNWKLSGGFGGFGASVGVQSRLATKGNKDVKLGLSGPGGAKVGLEFCAPSTYGRGAGKIK
jgi:hypothetical protein